MTCALRLPASLVLLATLSFAQGAESAFYDQLRARAEKLAASPYVKPTGQVPDWLRQLTYDDLRKIAFEGKRTLWLEQNLPFQVQFLHPGFLFDQTVKLSVLEEGGPKPIPFRRDYFQYRQAPAGEIPDDLGFAGFRLMYPFGGRGQPHQEIGSFAGASYFRFLGAETPYGLSARGLALDTGEPHPEEFPRFTEFWLERPGRSAKAMVVYALLDSESVSGAYRFTITPGPATVVQVRATVFSRKPVKVFGVAPLTSMYWHGENTSSPTRDFRPEVHDSDGLLLHTGAGEWIWRPLVNPPGVRVSAFADDNPRAFGLLQRDRNFEHYQDLEAAYHARPSAWVEPVGQWGRGSVRLVEIPTTTEFDDNMVAFWVPEQPPAPGRPLELEYRIHWFMDQITPPAGFARSTRHGRSAAYEPGMERFVIDFDGQALQRRKGESGVEADITVGEAAKLHFSSVQKNPINGTWRLAFTVKPDGSGRPVELRCFLRAGSDTLTETWSYLWQP